MLPVGYIAYLRYGVYRSCQEGVIIKNLLKYKIIMCVRAVR